MVGVLAPMIAAFKLPDLRRRILFVFGMFAVYVVGLHVPVPNVDHDAMREFVQQGPLLGLFDMFTGGGFSKFSVLAMGIMPYINASMISQWTRWLTIFLAIVQGSMMCAYLSRTPILNASGLALAPIVLTLTAGTCFLIWMGEQITDKGIGNGVSLIIFAGIVARMPADVMLTIQNWRAGVLVWANIFGLLVIWLVTIAGIIYITKGERRISIQSAKRVVGTRIYSGGSSFLPIRVNTAGVIPIIFAIAVVLLPAQIASFGQGLSGRWGDIMRQMGDFFSPGQNWMASGIYFATVIFFTYFYTAVSFNVADVADNLKKYGSFIPGIRPGRPTERHLDRVLSRITLAGALFLGVIALLSYYVPVITGVTSFTVVGGTSLLILVGVALDTMQQIEGHLVMRQYEGFIR